MSTFRVKNNYSDGYVDENGFIRKNIHEVVKEIEKKIDMIDPNGDNNEFITKVENHMEAVNQTVMNQNLSIDSINMHLNKVIEPKINNLETVVNISVDVPLLGTIEESKTNGSTGTVGYNSTLTEYPIKNVLNLSSYHAVQREHDSRVIKDILRRINNMNLDLLTRVEIKKSDWTSNHTGYRYYQFINSAASDGRESFTITEPFPSDYNTLSEYLSELSKSIFGYINEIFTRLVQVEHKLWDTQSSFQTSSTSWNEYLKDKPDTKYLDL